jgi:hypothetical protein
MAASRTDGLLAEAVDDAVLEIHDKQEKSMTSRTGRESDRVALGFPLESVTVVSADRFAARA